MEVQNEDLQKKNAIQDFDISQEETFFHCCKQNLVLVRLAICYAHATPTSYDLHWNGFFLHKTPLCGTLLWWMDALFWTSKSQHPFTAIIKLGEPEHVFYITQIVIIWKKSLTPRMAWGWENHGVILIFGWTIPWGHYSYIISIYRKLWWLVVVWTQELIQLWTNHSFIHFHMSQIISPEEFLKRFQRLCSDLQWSQISFLSHFKWEIMS